MPVGMENKVFLFDFLNGRQLYNIAVYSATLEAKRKKRGILLWLKSQNLT